MQSFKQSLNGCKGLFTRLTGLAPSPASGPGPPEPHGALSPPHPTQTSCSPTAHRPCLHAGPWSCRDSSESCQRQSLPSYGQPPPLPGHLRSGWQLHATATAEKPTAGCVLLCPKAGSWGGEPRQGSIQPPLPAPAPARHTRDSTRYFFKHTNSRWCLSLIFRLQFPKYSDMIDYKSIM